MCFPRSPLILFFATLGLIFCLEFLFHHSILRDVYAPSFGAPQGYYSYREEEGMVDIKPNVGTSTHYMAEGSYKVWSNKEGCFDRPFAEGGGPYIYLTGDSFTWGYTSFENMWGTVMEDLTGVRVAKCGLASVGTLQELIKAERTIPLLGKPSLIVVGYHGFTDPDDDIWFLRAQSQEGKGSTMPSRWQCVSNQESFFLDVKCWLEKNSLLYNVLKTTFRHTIEFPPGLKKFMDHLFFVAPPKVEPATPFEQSVHQESILAFKALAARQDADILFVLLPTSQEVRFASSSASSVAAIDFLEKNGIRYLNLFPELRNFSRKTGLPLYGKKVAPFNKKGNHLTGALVSQYVYEQGILPADLLAEERIRDYLNALNDEKEI